MAKARVIRINFTVTANQRHPYVEKYGIVLA